MSTEPTSGGAKSYRHGKLLVCVMRSYVAPFSVDSVSIFTEGLDPLGLPHWRLKEQLGQYGSQLVADLIEMARLDVVEKDPA